MVSFWSLPEKATVTKVMAVEFETTVDGSEIWRLHQLRLVVCPIIDTVSLTSQVGCLGFLNHQQTMMPITSHEGLKLNEVIFPK